jgi:hypothetical protein
MAAAVTRPSSVSDTVEEKQRKGDSSLQAKKQPQVIEETAAPSQGEVSLSKLTCLRRVEFRQELT